MLRAKTLKITVLAGLTFLIMLTLSIGPQLKLPTQTGPYRVGQTVFKWVDRSRSEVLTDNPDDFREVVAKVWYPAEAGTGTQAPYFPGLSTVLKALVDSGEVAAWEVFGLRFIRSENLLNAEPAKRQAPYPILILSPGNGTNIEFYTGLAGEIASYGYVVVGLNHPYDVAVVELSYGEVAPYNKAQWSLEPGAHQAYTAERIKVRTVDVLFALDQLERIYSDGHHPFHGMLDLETVAVAGHSLGGITASEACKAEPRFRSCLNFDGLQKGGPFSMAESAIPPDQPFMFMTKESELHPSLVKRFEAMPEGYWVVIHGASHQSFTDGPVLQPSLWPSPNQADQIIALIQKYTLAFLDQTLKNQPSSLLSKSVHGEDVSVSVYTSN